MKINVKKITSVTLLTSLILTNISSPIMSATAGVMESENVVVNAEEMEVSAAETLTEELATKEDSGLESSIMLAEEAESQITEISETENVSEQTAVVTEHFGETKSEGVIEENQTDSMENVIAGTDASEVETESQENTEDSAFHETESETGNSSETVAETESINETETVTEVETESEKNAEGESDAETKMESEALAEQNHDIQVKLELVATEASAGTIHETLQGDAQEVKITVVNPTEEEMKFRLYFWDYSGEEKNGKNIPNELLTDPCEELEIPALGEGEHFSIFLTGSEDVISVECTLHEEWQEEFMSARYLDVVIPSGYTWEDLVAVENEMAETVVIDPVIVRDDTQELESVVLTWNERERIEATENAEEQVNEVTDITDEETGITANEEPIAESDAEVISEETEKSEEPEEGAEETEQLAMILDDLNPADFASKKLIVMCSDASKILEMDQVIGCYENIYLIEYKTVEECMEAYVYYTETADAVEPDTFMEIASDEVNEVDESAGTIDETENTITEDNPITALSNTEGAAVLSDGQTRVIALLDTGASGSANVISRVSLIDDVLEGHSHGNAMVKAITSQNPDAQILSIRVMGNDGRGTVSAIVAGMEYAMENGASIINLSLSSAKNSLNAVLEAEIQKAVSMGIIVVGAAGNNAADVMNYMPGSVGAAYIIGACNEYGVRISSSNYGSTVDYNVIAGTTSEAAAKFSGCVSLSGIGGIVINEGVVYTTDYVAATPDTEGETEETEDGTVEDETNDMEVIDPEADILTKEELEDMAGEETEGAYPAKGSSISDTVKIWTKDAAYDFISYNPYEADENVLVSCSSEVPEFTVTAGEKVQMEYICSLKEEESYKWHLYVTFEFVDDRTTATEGSEVLETLMPEMVNQDRNAGYGGIVPEYTGTTVAGREFMVLKDDTEFDIYGLLVDYNPETFKVNNLVLNWNPKFLFAKLTSDSAYLLQD